MDPLHSERAKENCKFADKGSTDDQLLACQSQQASIVPCKRAWYYVPWDAPHVHGSPGPLHGELRKRGNRCATAGAIQRPAKEQQNREKTAIAQV